MTMTEDLRRMLDDRGVEWSVNFYPDSGFTRWQSRGVVWNACDLDDGILVNSNDPITPEDVIAATVGEEHEMHICKRCGVAYELSIIDKGFGKPRFCPNCGRRIEVDE